MFIGESSMGTRTLSTTAAAQIEFLGKPVMFLGSGVGIRWIEATTSVYKYFGNSQQNK